MIDDKTYIILINFIVWIFIILIPPYILSNLLIKRLNLDNKLIKTLILLIFILFNSYIARNFFEYIDKYPVIFNLS